MGNVQNKIESLGSHAFSEVSNGVDSVGHAIGSVVGDAKDVVTNVAQGVKDVVEHTEDTVGSVIKTGEYGIILPLAAIGIGLAVMMMRSNSGTIESLGSAAIQKI